MFYLKAQAFRNFVNSYRKTLTETIDPLIALKDSKNEIFDILKERNARLRFFISLHITFEKMKDGELINHMFYFNSNTERLLSIYELEEKFNSSILKILKKIEDFLNFGSGWSIKSIDFIDLHVGYYHEIRGGCNQINLPKILKNKKCLLDIHCENNVFFTFSFSRTFSSKIQ